MFAENGKISKQEMRSLLVLGWIGKQSLLFPILLKSLYGWEKTAALLLSLVWIVLFISLLKKVRKKREASMPKAHMYLIGIPFFFYLLSNELYLIRVTARVSAVCILPETGETALCLLLLFAAWMAEVGDAQKRGRAAQALYPVVLIALLTLMIAALWGIQPTYLWKALNGNTEDAVKMLPPTWSAGAVADLIQTSPALAKGIAVTGASLLLAASFAEMELLLFENMYIDCRTMRGSVLRVMGSMCLLTILMIGSFGATPLNRLEWPVPVLMSSVKLPGDFLQRWDVIFLAILLFGLFTAISSGLHGLHRIAGELLPRHLMRLRRPEAAGILVLLCLIAVGEYEQAEWLYLKLTLCIIVPVMTAVLLIIWGMRTGNEKETHTKTEIQDTGEADR
ncbi:MAG: GerAB/ArcD/ProY family transporter [Eubacteriales bacterium]|nr:GerAB/ArcD/ProY family transporter [Eubacteriales bacterium]